MDMHSPCVQSGNRVPVDGEIEGETEIIQSSSTTENPPTLQVIRPSQSKSQTKQIAEQNYACDIENPKASHRIKEDNEDENESDFQKIFRKLDQNDAGGVDPFELHCALIATNTLVPLDIVIAIFHAADKNGDGILSFDEFSKFLSKFDRLYEKPSLFHWAKHQSAIKSLLCDVKFIMVSCYTLAGLLLVVPAFGVDTFSSNANAAMSIMASFFYVLPGGYFAIKGPYDTWKHQILCEERARIFKTNMILLCTSQYNKSETQGQPLSTETEDDRIMHNATLCRDHTCMDTCATSTSKVDKKNLDLNAIIYKYVNESIYRCGVPLSKSDLEMMLLTELGDSVSVSVLDDIWTHMDKDHSSDIDAENFYNYLITKNPPPTSLQRLLSITWITMTDFCWLMCLTFFFASSLTLFSGILQRYQVAVHFWSVEPHIVSAWAFLIGTFYFTILSYNNVSKSFYLRESAKKMIIKWLTKMDEIDDGKEETQKKTSPIVRQLIVRFKGNEGLQKFGLNRLLEANGVYLPNNEVNAIFDAIDTTRNGKISRKEFDAYVQQQVSFKRLHILKLCSSNLDFWAQSSWVIGSFFYFVGNHLNDWKWKNLHYQIGAILYLLGALHLASYQYSCELVNQNYARTIYNALKKGKNEEVKLDKWKRITNVLGGEVRCSNFPPTYEGRTVDGNPKL